MKYIIPLFAAGLLSGCVGTSKDADVASPIVNPDNLSLASDESTLSFDTNNLSLTLARDTLYEYDFGSFELGQTIKAEGRQILLASGTENTGAVLLISPDDGVAADIFEGRFTPLEELPPGQAELSGDYVGVFLDSYNDTPSLPVVGTVTLFADFENMTISGEITDRQTSNDFSADGGAVPAGTLYGINDVIFAETAIKENGLFSGGADYPLDGELIGEPDGTYSGVFGGPNGEEVVGRFVTSQSGVDFVYGEVGVFAIGH